MPFTVITVKSSPPSLRGDLTKWMQEIATGVYVGNFNQKIREKLWERVKENIGKGEATLSYTCRNEIGYSFETYHTDREIIHYDGIPLVLIPKRKIESEDKKTQYGFSDAAKRVRARRASGTRNQQKRANAYAFIDIETDGLDQKTNNIIEIGAIKYEDNHVSEFSSLIVHEKKLAKNIMELTNISDEMLQKQGQPLKKVLEDFLRFIGNDSILVGYSIAFDIGFLNKNLKEKNLPIIQNKIFDLLHFVKKEKMFLNNYKLETVLRTYGIKQKVPHRALEDARLILELSKKVKKINLFEKRK